MESEEKKQDELGDKSPYAGCAILIAALAVMVFLVGFSVYALFKQASEIAKFTDKKPAEIALVSLEDREPDLNKLAEKLEVFRLAVSDGESAVLELDAGEMNLAIAAYEPFKDLRGTLRVLEISPEQMKLGISFQLNGKPRFSKDDEKGLMTSDPQYLNGTLIAVPGLSQREIVLQISDIQVDGAVVPKEFIGQMSPYRIAEGYLGTERIGKTMDALTDVELGEGVVRFIKKSGVVPKDTVTNEQVDIMSKKVFTFFGIAACLFLVFVGMVLLGGFYLKRKRENAS